jgi:hypothetical protein
VAGLLLQPYLKLETVYLLNRNCRHPDFEKGFYNIQLPKAMHVLQLARFGMDGMPQNSD